MEDRAALVGVPYVFYPEEDSVSLLELIRLFYAERRLIAAIVGVAMLASLIPAILAKQVYRAEVLLAPVQLNKNEGIAALVGQFGDLATLVERYVGSSKDQTAESIATLRSRVLAMSFIQEHDLKPRVFKDKWDAANRKWRDPAQAPTDLEAYDIFDKQIRSVDVDPRSGLVALAIEWDDPQLAAAWANALVTTVNERRRAEAIQEARQSIKYLEQQLHRTSSVEIRQSLYHLVEAQTKSIALAHARKEYAFKVIDPAVPPEEPLPRWRLLMVAFGFIVGVVTALGVVLLRRALRRESASLGPLA